VSANLSNFDLRWEWYPTEGVPDLVSASAFFKYFEKPIEKVILSSASEDYTSWANAKEAHLLGFELEGKKNLEFAWKYLKDFSLKANFAFIQSEVQTEESSQFKQTNPKRPLQGQPDYTVNLGLFYTNPDWGFSGAVLASSFGERISAVGSYGLEDEIEVPRWTLDMTFSKKLGPGSLRLSFENLLDATYEFKRGDITTREYTKGLALGLSYSMSF
jgi:outer membrane receptor protein involved in Fe transport